MSDKKSVSTYQTQDPLSHRYRSGDVFLVDPLTRDPLIKSYIYYFIEKCTDNISRCFHSYDFTIENIFVTAPTHTSRIIFFTDDDDLAVYTLYNFFNITVVKPWYIAIPNNVYDHALKIVDILKQVIKKEVADPELVNHIGYKLFFYRPGVGQLNTKTVLGTPLTPPLPYTLVMLTTDS